MDYGSKHIPHIFVPTINILMPIILSDLRLPHIKCPNVALTLLIMSQIQHKVLSTITLN